MRAKTQAIKYWRNHLKSHGVSDLKFALKTLPSNAFASRHYYIDNKVWLVRLRHHPFEVVLGHLDAIKHGNMLLKGLGYSSKMILHAITKTLAMIGPIKMETTDGP